MASRFVLRLTEWERDEVISVLQAARDHGLAYGHIAGGALTRAENRRDALIAKIEASPRERA